MPAEIHVRVGYYRKESGAELCAIQEKFGVFKKIREVSRKIKIFYLGKGKSATSAGSRVAGSRSVGSSVSLRTLGNVRSGAPVRTPVLGLHHLLASAGQLLRSTREWWDPGQRLLVLGQRET
jgi:hypothetical protein